MLGLCPKVAALAQTGGAVDPALLPADFISIASNGIVTITARNPESGDTATISASRLQRDFFTATGERTRTLPITKQGFSFGVKAF